MIGLGAAGADLGNDVVDAVGLAGLRHTTRADSATFFSLGVFSGIALQLLRSRPGRGDDTPGLVAGNPFGGSRWAWRSSSGW